jgi:hypothetical protein
VQAHAFAAKVQPRRVVRGDEDALCVPHSFINDLIEDRLGDVRRHAVKCGKLNLSAPGVAKICKGRATVVELDKGVGAGCVRY